MRKGSFLAWATSHWWGGGKPTDGGCQWVVFELSLWLDIETPELKFFNNKSIRNQQDKEFWEISKYLEQFPSKEPMGQRRNHEI